MSNMKEITDEQARYTIDNGELPDEVISAAGRVAVVLTQDWCPQWATMESYIGDLTEETESPILVYVLIYNRVPYFSDFLDFKESTWGNRQIPYVRYYRDGRLVNQTNYVPKSTFTACFDAE